MNNETPKVILETSLGNIKLELFGAFAQRRSTGY